MENLKLYVGVLKGSDKESAKYYRPTSISFEASTLPETFDLRTKWPNCKSLFSIHNQGKELFKLFYSSENFSFKYQECAVNLGIVQEGHPG